MFLYTLTSSKWAIWMKCFTVWLIIFLPCAVICLAEHFSLAPLALIIHNLNDLETFCFIIYEDTNPTT